MRFIHATSFAALIAALAAAGALAQEAEWSAEGQLEDSDAQDADGQRYDDHHVRLEAGRRYRLTASSEDFDTVLRLFARGSSEPLAENDDSAGSLNSRVTYAPRQSGDYVLRVVSFSAEGRGAYRVTAGPVPPLPPPISEPILQIEATGSWTLWQGALGPGDGEADGRRFDDYRVRFEAGQRRFISLESSAFDPVVEVLTLEGRELEPPEALDGDDDTGVGFNSLLAFAPEEAGDYIVRVTQFGEGEGGAYTLWISN